MSEEIKTGLMGAVATLCLLRLRHHDCYLIWGLNVVKNMVDEDNTINKLDDDLLRRILDLLPIKDAVQSSVLSSRWQNLWRSISNIDIKYCSCLSNDDNAFSFLDLIDKILIGHDSSDIKRFIVYSDVDVDTTRIHRWITDVIKHNVEELRLDFTIEETCILPLCLFKSESLTVLEIDFGKDFILGSDPSLFSVHLPSLKRLELSGVRFLDNHCTQHFFSNIPKLQQLCLSACYWEKVDRLVIDIPTLERVFVCIEGFHKLDCVVTVIAPNLTYFKCDTDFSIDFLLSNHSLSLNVFCKAHIHRDENRIALIRLLESVKKLQTLQVKWNFIRGLDFEGIAANDLPVFMNLTRLEIFANRYNTGTNDSVKKMILFLHNTPNLQSLTITLMGEDTLYHWLFEDVTSSGDVPSCVIYQIKRVSISSKFDTYEFHNKSMAMGLVDYFMNHSQSLEMLEVNELSKDLCPTWVMKKIERHPRYLELKNFSCSINAVSKPR